MVRRFDFLRQRIAYSSPLIYIFLAITNMDFIFSWHLRLGRTSYYAQVRTYEGKIWNLTAICFINVSTLPLYY
jgi:hypothetical protein